MAWVYRKYPRTRQEALRAAMSIREEDIDYSDIPPLEITEHTKIERVGDKFKKVRERNSARILEMFDEYHEMKQTLAKLQQEHPELF